MDPILQRSLPYDVGVKRPLPSVRPLQRSDWLHIDEAYERQMGERDRLLAEQRPSVVVLSDTAWPAAQELLDLVLSDLGLRSDFCVQPAEVQRPDGVWVQIDRCDPMGTLGRLVQEDLCLLEKSSEEHLLTGAVLCFPASWTLADKFMRPLTVIHEPVELYDENMALRVQRMFDGINPIRPIWRYNLLNYSDPTLYQPRSTIETRDRDEGICLQYIRSERQCVLRMPQTNAVVFSIHTYVLKNPNWVI